MKFPKPTFAFALFAPLLLCGCQLFTWCMPEDDAAATPAVDTSTPADVTTPPADAKADTAAKPATPVATPAKPTIAPGQPGYIKQQAKIGEATMAVKAQLDAFAQKHVSRANATLKPNRTLPAVTKEKGVYVARYLEIDVDTLTTEIYPSTAPGCSYVGHVVYLEKVYESTGNTKMQAETGTFKHVRARRIREITRYSKGAWVY
ncbi:MAG: hypothetical protein RR317_02650 [Bilophila sp.]